MRGKIIAAIICMMLLTTFFAIAKNNENVESQIVKDNEKPLSFDEVDVSIWEVGDSWTFNIASMDFVIDDDNLSENLTIEFSIEIGDFTLEVIDDSGDTYEVEIAETPILGDYLIDTDLGDGPILVTGSLEDTTISGTILFNQADLGMKQFNGMIDGKLTINVEEQPYFDGSLFPEIPVAVTINIAVGMDPPLPIIEFPLNSTFDVWGLPATNVSLGGTIESPWLNLFNFINERIRQRDIIFRLVSLLLGVDEQVLRDASDIIADILPIIDIEYVLNEYLGVDNVLPIPEIPFMFFCNDTVEITVPADTFECYEIMVAGGLGTIYFSPDVKYIVKMEGDFGDALPFLNGIDVELVSYS